MELSESIGHTPNKNSEAHNLNAIPFEVLEAIYRCEHFVVFGHQKPDADCVTSQLSMFLALQRLHKSAQLVSAGPFLRPEIKALAPKFDSEIDQKKIAKVGRDKVLAIILDCSTTERTGFAKELQDLSILIIDHHASGEIEGDLSYCDPRSPSTSILVHNMLLHLPLFLFQMAPQDNASLLKENVEDLFIDQEIASLLFLGFATDTGFFRFLKPNNAGNMLRQVSTLVDTQIDLQDIYQHMTGGRLLGTRRILGLLLLRAGFLLDGRLCISYELLEDKKFWDTETNDSDSFYNLSLATQNCEAILLLNQAETGLWNVGLRSLKQHDVGSIAAKFGGGGHKNAAGCRVESTELNQVLKLLLAEVSKLWDLNANEQNEIEDYITSAPRFLVGQFS